MFLFFWICEKGFRTGVVAIRPSVQPPQQLDLVCYRALFTWKNCSSTKRVKLFVSVIFLCAYSISNYLQLPTMSISQISGEGLISLNAGKLGDQFRVIQSVLSGHDTTLSSLKGSKDELDEVKRTCARLADDVMKSKAVVSQ
jgi:hypothetical protein